MSEQKGIMYAECAIKWGLKGLIDEAVNLAEVVKGQKSPCEYCTGCIRKDGRKVFCENFIYKFKQIYYEEG